MVRESLRHQGTDSDCTDGVCKATVDLSEIDVDEIVKSVISRLRNY